MQASGFGDLYVGNTDANRIVLYGAQGIDATGNNWTFRWVLKGSNSFITPATTWWFGPLSSLTTNIWTQTAATSWTTDSNSGMAISWQRKSIDVGETIYLQSLWGVGQQPASIPASMTRGSWTASLPERTPAPLSTGIEVNSVTGGPISSANFDIWAMAGDTKIWTSFGGNGWRTILNISGTTSEFYGMADATISGVRMSTRINQVSPFYVQLEFELMNTATSARMASVGIFCDLYVGNTDSDEITLYGTEGIDITGNGFAFRWVLKGSNPLVTPATTWWFGEHGDENDNLWTQAAATSMSLNMDSGMAMSWQQWSIGAGERIYLRSLWGVGVPPISSSLPSMTQSATAPERTPGIAPSPLEISFVTGGPVNWNNFDIWALAGEKRILISGVGWQTFLNVSGTTSDIYGMTDTIVSDVRISTRINQISPLYVQLEFELTNTGITTRNASVGILCDLYVGNTDRNDITLYGTEGIDATGDGWTFRWVLKGSNPFITSATNWWFGYFGDRGTNVWTQTIATSVSSNIDSGMAISWQQKSITPGRTIFLRS
jgi:hypothetical protein